MYSLNKNYQITVTKEIINGRECLQIVGVDLVVVIRPRDHFKPTQVIVDAPTSKTVVSRTETGLDVVELFADIMQSGIGKNPVKEDHKSLIRSIEETKILKQTSDNLTKHLKDIPDTHINNTPDTHINNTPDTHINT